MNSFEVGLVVGMAIGAFGLSIVSAIFAFKSYARVVGFENSTHKIQYVPIDENGNTGKALEKEMAEAFHVGELEEDHL